MKAAALYQISTATFLDYFSVFAHQAHKVAYRAGPRDDFVEAQPPHLLPVQTLLLRAHVRAGSHEGLGVNAAKCLLAQLCEAHSFQHPGIRAASSITPSWPNCQLGAGRGMHDSKGCYLSHCSNPGCFLNITENGHNSI